MKTLKICSIILTVLVLILTVTGFFIDGHLSEIGSYIYRTAELLILAAVLVIDGLLLAKEINNG